MHLVLNLINDHHALALLETEELVHCVVHFRTDLLAWLEIHNHQLAELPGIDDPAEIFVLCGFFFNIPNKSLFHHFESPFNQGLFFLVGIQFTKPY